MTEDDQRRAVRLIDVNILATDKVVEMILINEPTLPDAF